MKFCAVLGAQGIRATGFKHPQGKAHCTKFESNTNRMTFETNAISTTSDIQALMILLRIGNRHDCLLGLSDTLRTLLHKCM